MRRRMWMAMLVACCATSAPLWGQPAGQVPLPPLEPLIQQLGDRDYRTREAAGRQLELRGEQALPVLRQSLSNADPEVKRRIAVLLQKIERKVLLSAKRVTLDLEDRPFQEAIDEVCRQTGYRVTLENKLKQKITIKLTDVTFWQAIDRICTIGGLSLGGDDADGSLRLFQQDTYSPYIAYSGPYRLMATNIHSNKTVNLAFLPRQALENQQPPENLSFSFQINCEPKSALLAVGQPMLTKAEDQDGASLMFREDDPNNPYRVNYPPQNFFRATQTQSQFQLSRNSRNSTRIKMLHAKVPVIVLSDAIPEITIDNILKVKNGKYSGKTVDIDVESVTDGNSEITISMTVRRLGKNVTQDDNWVNCVFQRLELTDAKGRKYPSQGINNFIASSPAHIQAVFQFGKNGDLGPPTKLTYYHWLTAAHELEFEFKDVPLP